MVNKTGQIIAPGKNQGFNSSTPGASYSQTTNPGGNGPTHLPGTAPPPGAIAAAAYHPFPPGQFATDPNFAGAAGPYAPPPAYAQGCPPPLPGGYVESPDAAAAESEAVAQNPTDQSPAATEDVVNGDAANEDTVMEEQAEGAVVEAPVQEEIEEIAPMAPRPEETVEEPEEDSKIADAETVNV